AQLKVHVNRDVFWIVAPVPTVWPAAITRCWSDAAHEQPAGLVVVVVVVLIVVVVDSAGAPRPPARPAAGSSSSDSTAGPSSMPSHVPSASARVKASARASAASVRQLESTAAPVSTAEAKHASRALAALPAALSFLPAHFSPARFCPSGESPDVISLRTAM